MNSAAAYRLVLVTAPDRPTARRLAARALEARLVACANLVPQIESHYWWQGQIERGREVLILFKTRAAHLEALEALLLREHPYDTPEILAVPLGRGTPRYLRWLAESTARPPARPTRTKPAKANESSKGCQGSAKVEAGRGKVVPRSKA